MISELTDQLQDHDRSAAAGVRIDLQRRVDQMILEIDGKKNKELDLSSLN